MVELSIPPYRLQHHSFIFMPILPSRFPNNHRFFMELAPPTATAGGGGAAGVGGGGPAPFLLKTYEMVDDSKTDEIVSWSSSNNSFVVWNPPEFARILLPTYFKHNNFSSFIRQLNTYGFRKIDPEKWEFANEEFVKDQKHLLKNIHRRKPIHSHSNPPGSSVDPERAAFVEEIERLSHEKAKLEGNILAFKQQRSSAKAQGDEWTQRVDSLEERQDKLLSHLEKALQNPNFIESLAKKIESMDFSAYSKKRRLPQDDHTKTPDNSFLENHSSSRPEFGSVISQDLSNKLRLELSPAVSDINLISHSTHSSYEDGTSPYRRISEGDPKDAHARTSVLLFAPETLELSDTGTSYTFKVDPTHPRKVPANESPGLHSLQQNFSSSEEGDGHISCHLNLTLASSPMQVNKSPYSNGPPKLAQEVGKSPDLRFNDSGKDSNMETSPKCRSFVDEDTTLSSSREAPNNNQGPAAAPPRVNDVFWEQFLTERPGSSDTEEASSNYRASTNEDHGDRRLGFGLSRNAKINGQLSL